MYTRPSLPPVYKLVYTRHEYILVYTRPSLPLSIHKCILDHLYPLSITELNENGREGVCIQNNLVKVKAAVYSVHSTLVYSLHLIQGLTLLSHTSLRTFIFTHSDKYKPTIFI